MFKPTSKLVYLASTFFAVGSLFLSSCKDDDKSIRPSVEIPTKFSEKTAEQNKAALESNGIQLVENLDDFRESEGVRALVSLNTALEAGLPANGRVATENPAGKMMKIVAAFGRGNADAKEVLSAMRVNQDDDLSPQEEFDQAAGVYTYSNANDSWTKTAGSDKIVFQFPSTAEGATNNAEVSIYDFTTVEVSNPELEYNDDLPTGVKADMKVDGSTLVQYTFTASYKSNGEPTSVATSLTIAPFKFSFNAKNTSSEVASDYAFTKSDQNLISFGMGASGTFTSDAVAGEEGAQSVVKDASAYFQIMDIKFAGKINVDKLNQVDESEEEIDVIQLLNDATDLVVYYASTKEKIAEGEFYTNTTQECYDTDGNGVEDYCYEEEVTDIRLIFKDGSPVDLATYTNDGFDTLSTTFEDFVTALEEDLG